MQTNPFALRLQLISIAKDLLVDEYHTKREYALEQWRIKVDRSRENGSDAEGAPKLPDYPTENDILRKASILNEFVSKTK